MCMADNPIKSELDCPRCNKPMLWKNLEKPLCPICDAEAVSKAYAGNTGLASERYEHSVIIFGQSGSEMIRVSKDSFFIRGVKIEQDKDEAKKVYEAIIKLLFGAK